MTVAGRIMLKRDTGKLVFVTIAERGAEVQLFVSKAVIGDEGFAAVKALDRGDWVGAHGTVMTTRAGELSVKVDRVELLAKSLRPLPDKWHGLSDPDTRFRQRYVDLVVNADARRVFDVRHAVDRQLPPHARRARATSRSRRRCCTSRPGAPTPARSSPTTTRSTCRCTCASPSSCT